MIPGKTYTPEDFLWMAWRHRWLIVVPLVFCGCATAIWTHSLPNRYRSETVILVVPQRVPETYVRSTVTDRIEDRLRSINPQILGRTRLERIIQQLNLYIEERRSSTMEEIVQRMRADITIDPPKDGETFRVSYVSGDPRKAMEVTEQLASLYIEENLHDREILAEGTSEFLESQLETARQRLVETEKKLEEYRRQHAGELPSQLDSNLQGMRGAQLQLQALADSISRDRDRIVSLEQLIADGLAADSLSTSGTLTPASRSADSSPASGSAAERLKAAEESLRALRRRLKDEHPDVIRQKQVIRDLQREADLEARNRPAGGSAAAPPVSAAEAARRARARDLQKEVDTLKQQIARKEAEEQRLQDQIAMYQQRIEAVPTRESELAELTRDYQTLQGLYTSLLGKREDSQIAANLERRQVGAQFRILDAPRVPEKPFSPDRTKLNAIGTFVGLLLGAGIAAFLEYRDTSLRTEEDLVSTLALPVYAVIPVMTTDDERRRSRRRKLVFGGAALAMLLLGAGAAIAAWKFGIIPWVA